MCMDLLRTLSGTDGTLNCSDSSNETIQHGVVIKGSLKAKITSSLKISSKNLQISDPIGQGKPEKWMTLHYTHVHRMYNITYAHD